MPYLKSKSISRFEYRVYIDDGQDFDGIEIFRGHKLEPEYNLLSEILDYRIDRGKNKIYFLKYDKVVTEPDFMIGEMWDMGKEDTYKKNLLDSWSSLNQKMRGEFGDYRKIIITKVNI
jgi:hypothetical protein